MTSTPCPLSEKEFFCDVARIVCDVAAQHSMHAALLKLTAAVDQLMEPHDVLRHPFPQT